MDASRAAHSNHSQSRTTPYSPLNDESAVIVTGSRTYLAEPGNRLRTLKCVICREPVAGRPFVLHFLTSAEICRAGEDHLSSICGATHACHHGVPQDEIAEHIAAIARHELLT